MSKRYPVDPSFAAAARLRHDDYTRLYAESVSDPEGFWGRIGQRLDWIKPPTKIKDVSFDPKDLHIRWYEDGELNVSANCLDRQLAGRGDKVAIIFEGDDPKESRKITYRELHAEVCKFANTLKHLGVAKGDRVAIYLPMIPEAAVAMLACARLGAIHSVVFGGFSPDSLAGRIADSQAKVVVTADEGLRAGRRIPLKVNVDAALERPGTNSVETVIVVRRTGGAVAMQSPRDRYYHTLMDGQSADCAPTPVEAEHPLFILYTSGSTGKPKGVLHTTGGYLVYTSYTHELVFDLREDDVYWCTADVGWVTGHSYVVYGPLANGATTVMFEGVPNYPDYSRFWQVIDKHKVSIFYTAPTAIRALMREGEEPVKKTSRASLRLLGSVGEPINPEAWEWYYRVVGDERCPIVDTWWQTETGGIMISPLPGAIATKPGSATLPFFGVKPAIVDAEGTVQQGAAEGNLLITDSWPGQMRTIYGDHQRFIETYFSTYPGNYFTGDGCAPRRGRLLLDHRPRRRRDQRLRPPPGHRRGGKRAGGAPEGGRGRRGRLPARHQGPGHLCLCHADCRRNRQRRVAQGTDRLGAQGDRPDRHAGLPAVGARPAEDPLGQDHAAHPAQDRREPARPARRHHHPGRSRRGEEPGRRAADQMRSGERGMGNGERAGWSWARPGAADVDRKRSRPAAGRAPVPRSPSSVPRPGSPCPIS